MQLLGVRVLCVLVGQFYCISSAIPTGENKKGVSHETDAECGVP